MPDAMCFKPGYEMAAPTFVPRCTLPGGHDGPCNWAERMELRAKLRRHAPVQFDLREAVRAALAAALEGTQP